MINIYFLKKLNRLFKSKRIRYFKSSEFDSPDKPGSGKKMDWRFLEMIDEARHKAGISFRINSGFRTKEHNEKVGGKANSAHLKGKAVDIECITSRQRQKILTALIQVGFTRIGISFKSGFIHVDNDPSLPQDVIWGY